MTAHVRAPFVRPCLALAASLTFLGCAPPQEDNTPDAMESDDPDEETATSQGPGEEEEEEEETEGDADETEGEDTDDGCSFIGCDTDGEPGIERECDPWAQDCPSGEKCAPWANDGGTSWNATRCVEIDPTPGEPGDACQVEGSGVSGIDSCAVSSMCWNVDGETNEGTCVSFCAGSEANPVCDNPSTSCIIANDGVLNLCLPACDPLLQDCEDGQACYPSDRGFVCAPDASGPDLGDYASPCEFTNSCDPGLLCGAAAAVPGCTGSLGCCTEYCDLEAAEPSASCSGLSGGQECVAAYPEGDAPPGLEDVGLCAIPE